MKKVLLSILLLVLVISFASAVSLPWAPVCSYGVCDNRPNQTLVWGKVIDNANAKGIVGAYVHVECNGYELERLSTHSGYYAVFFAQEHCQLGDTVTVTSSYGDLYGVKTGIIDQNLEQWFAVVDMDLTRIDVPLVPEFGMIVGALTIVSAIGVFFVVRRDK